MKFKCVAVGYTVTFWNTQKAAQEWAETVARKNNCDVKIYEFEERLLKTIPAPSLPPPPKKECMYNHETLRLTSSRSNCPECGEVIKQNG